MGQTLLMTGRPGVGKTTIIKKVAAVLGDQAGGFYTEEIRSSSGRRVGFRLVTLKGHEAVMAHVNLRDQGRPRVSRYGVDVSAIEELGVVAIREAVASSRVVIVDEIGKMELYCDAFKRAVRTAVEDKSPLLGTIMSARHPWVDDLKAREQVLVWEVTLENRDTLAQQILRWLKR